MPRGKKMSAKGSQFKEDDSALALYELLLYALPLKVRKSNLPVSKSSSLALTDRRCWFPFAGPSLKLVLKEAQKCWKEAWAFSEES